MKKIILGAFLALMLFIAILVMLAPAKVITPWITDAVPGLHLSNVNGSIWSANIAQAKYRNVVLENIKLEVNPLSLIAGKLNADVVIDDPNINIQADAILSSEDYKVENGQFDIDSSYVISLFRTPLQDLSGRVIGTVTDFRFNNNQLAALEGEGEWKSAIIHYPNNNLELGDIAFRLSEMSEQRNGARVEIINNKGVLDLQGYIEIGLDKQFNMNVHATDQLPANIKSWLTTWGRQRGDRIYLEWRGRLP